MVLLLALRRNAAEALQSQAVAEAAQAQADAASAHLSALSVGADAPLLEESDAEVARAQADVDEASVHLDQTELRSPISGTVLRRSAERGEHVSITPPTVVMTLAEGVDRRVRAEFDEEDIGQLAVRSIRNR